MTWLPEDRRMDTDRFYNILDGLAERVGGPRRLAECTAASGWPQQGVYFFFEDSQTRAGTDLPRVVRVGTHALTATSRTTCGTDSPSTAAR
jgi:hypothetical protein